MIYRFCGILFSFFFATKALSYTGTSPGTLTTDGSDTDVKAAIAAAAAGDIIVIPSGTFTWDEQVVIAEGITLRGAGAGGIVTRSASSVTIGTGEKTFTVDSGLSSVLVGGTSVKVLALHDGDQKQMTGTVSSYSGTTLVVNVTSTVNTGAGGDTWAAWAIRVAASTTIVNDYAGNAEYVMVQVTPDSSAHNTVIEKIRFLNGTSTGYHMEIEDGTKSVIVRNCEFSTRYMSGAVRVRTNHGIIHNCMFDTGLYAGDGNGPAFATDDVAISFYAVGLDATWDTVSTMGTQDTTGLNNFYVEDCRFTGVFAQTTDFSDNARVVFRYNILDSSGMTSHGHDTSPSGMRHVEIYNNTFLRDTIGPSGIYTYPMSYFIYIRGGTGVIYNNVIPDIDSQQWGNKNEILLTTFNIYQGNSVVDCQTAYPASRQPGRGYIDGSGPYNDGDPSDVFKGDLEPIYIWGNSGGGNWETPGLQTNSDTCGNEMNIADFIQANRDYYVNTAQPSWAAYTYPHPLRGESSTSFTPSPRRTLKTKVRK